MKLPVAHSGQNWKKVHFICVTWIITDADEEIVNYWAFESAESIFDVIFKIPTQRVPQRVIIFQITNYQIFSFDLFKRDLLKSANSFSMFFQSGLCSGSATGGHNLTVQCTKSGRSGDPSIDSKLEVE